MTLRKVSVRLLHVREPSSPVIWGCLWISFNYLLCWSVFCALINIALVDRFTFLRFYRGHIKLINSMKTYAKRELFVAGSLYSFIVSSNLMLNMSSLNPAHVVTQLLGYFIWKYCERSNRRIISLVYINQKNSDKLWFQTWSTLFPWRQLTAFMDQRLGKACLPDNP